MFIMFSSWLFTSSTIKIVKNIYIILDFKKAEIYLVSLGITLSSDSFCIITLVSG